MRLVKSASGSCPARCTALTCTCIECTARKQSQNMCSKTLLSNGTAIPAAPPSRYLLGSHRTRQPTMMGRLLPQPSIAPAIPDPFSARRIFHPRSRLPCKPCSSIRALPCVPRHRSPRPASWPATLPRQPLVCSSTCASSVHGTHCIERDLFHIALRDRWRKDRGNAYSVSPPMRGHPSPAGGNLSGFPMSYAPARGPHSASCACAHSSVATLVAPRIP